VIAYSWAYDKFKQALDRVHRMTSTKPVNVYVVLCSGTIDRKLESLIQDKGDAAELVLDGRLIGERTEEVNLAELLKTAHREFADDKTQTMDEGELHKQWTSTLKPQLQQAMQEWDRTCGVPVGTAVTTSSATSALEALRAMKNRTTSLRVDTVDASVVKSLPQLKSSANDGWRTRMADRAKKLAAQSRPDLCHFFESCAKRFCKSASTPANTS
jgi:hypothetical protein